MNKFSANEEIYIIYEKALVQTSHSHTDHGIVARWEHRTADATPPLKRWEVGEAHID